MGIDLSQVGDVDVKSRGEDILLTFVTTGGGFTRGPGLVGILLDAKEARVMMAKMEMILAGKV